MGFLKQFGLAILRAQQIVTGVGPLVPALAPQAAPIVQAVSRDLTEIARVIGMVEVMGQALGQPGPEKLKAAAPLVAQAILASSLMAGKSIADPELFQRGAAKLADGMADILNAIDANHVKTQKPQDVAA